MAKFTPTPVQSFTPLGLGTINANFNSVASALEKVLSRDGTSPNQMQADLDLNHNDLLNVKEVSANVGKFDTIVLGDDTQVVPKGAEVFRADSLPSLLASKTVYPLDALIITQDHGWMYKVVDSDGHLTTAGGVQLRTVDDNRYNPSAPFISMMDRFRQRGISPEDMDSGGEIVNEADAAIPIREMFRQGLDDGIGRFNFSAGKTYNLRSHDPLDTGESMAVFLDGVDQDITVNAHGAIIKGHNGIQVSDIAGAMFRVIGDGEGARRFIWNGGRIDSTELSRSSPEVPATVGGFYFGGGLSIEMRGILFDHGISTPSGDAIGVGGGDQGIAASAYESLLVDGCTFRGAPDLGIYLLNSQAKEARIVNNKFYRCNNAIAQKRRSNRSLIANNRFVECRIGVYNPSTESDDNNHGGAFYLFNNIFERTQLTPIDISGAVGGQSVVSGNVIRDFCRRISDGAEVTESGRREAIRIRVPNCVLVGNLIELDEWSLSTTPGKEQIGMFFGVSGSPVNMKADNCLSAHNLFKNLYRAHVFQNTTHLNTRRGNKRVNVTTYDEDNGDNSLPYRLLDDTMVTITPPNVRSLATFMTSTTGSGLPNGSVFLNMGGSPSAVNVSLQTTTNITLTTGVTDVSSAADENFTISANTGSVTIINRRGTTVAFDLQWMQE